MFLILRLAARSETQNPYGALAEPVWAVTRPFRAVKLSPDGGPTRSGSREQGVDGVPAANPFVEPGDSAGTPAEPGVSAHVGSDPGQVGDMGGQSGNWLASAGAPVAPAPVTPAPESRVPDRTAPVGPTSVDQAVAPAPAPPTGTAEDVWSPASAKVEEINEIDEAMATRLLGERALEVGADGPPSGVVPVVRRRSVGSDGEATSSGIGVVAPSVPIEPGLEVRRNRRDSKGPSKPKGKATTAGKGSKGTRRLTLVSSLLAVLFVAAMCGLVYAGYQLSLKITGGSADRITNEEEPGFVAPVRPTPTEMFAITDSEGDLATAFMVVGDASGTGGTVVPLPGDLIAPRTETLLPLNLRDAYADGGIELAQERLGGALGFRVGSAATIPSEAIVEMAGGEPVVVENADNLIELDEAGNEVLRYPAGELSLAPEEITDYLAFQGVGEPTPNQALRAQDVWQELFARNEGKNLEDLGGEGTSSTTGSADFGDAMTALLAGEFGFEQLPYAEEVVPEAYFVGWAPSAWEMPAFTVRVVPVPESPAPGVRFPTAILNGIGESSVMTPASQKVVSAGGEVALVGNADTFDVATTEVLYATDEAAEQAAAIAKEFGAEAKKSSDVPSGATIVVVLGEDSMGSLGVPQSGEGQ